MSAPPPTVRAGESLGLAVDVKLPRPGDTVTFTVATRDGEKVATVAGTVSGNTAKAVWVADADGRALPLDVTIRAALRGEEIKLGDTKLVSGTRVSTVGWHDARLQDVPVDPDEKMRIVKAGDTVFLSFDIDDGTGGAVAETLALRFVLEQQDGSGAFAPVATFDDETTGVKRFERKFQVPNDRPSPTTMRIALEVRRKGEAPSGPPSLGRRVSPPLRIVLAGPVVTSFLGVLASAKKSVPAEIVPFVKGDELRLSWEIQGPFDAVRIEPGSVDVTGDTHVGADGVGRGSRQIDPDANAPDDDGEYALIAANRGFQSNIRRVAAATITELKLEVGTERPAGKTILLTAKDGKTPIDSVLGLANKNFEDFGENDFQGQITPGGSVRVSWKIRGLGRCRVSLTGAGAWRNEDVTELTLDHGGEALLEHGDDSPGAVLDLKLVLSAPTDDPKKAPIAAQRIIRVRENYPLPRLESLEAVFDGTPVADGAVVTDWEKLKFRWTLSGSSKDNRLFAKVTAAGQTVEETWKDIHDGTQALDTHPRAGPFTGEVVVELRLVNLNDVVQGRKTVRVNVEKKVEPTPPPPPPPSPPDHKPMKMRIGFNYPWGMEKYGLDFRHSDVADGWKRNLKEHLKTFQSVRCAVLRWFIFANGWDYGEVTPVTRRVREDPFDREGTIKTFDYHCTAPGIHPIFIENFKALLEIFKEFNEDKAPSEQIKLIPVFADFALFNWRKGPKSGVGMRMDLARDPAKREAFLDNAFVPLLEASKPYSDQIYVWDVCNEPSWNTRVVAPPLHRYAESPDLSMAEMRAFLEGGVKRVKDAGFLSSVGHRFLSDLDDFPTGDIRQFHYYAKAYGNKIIDVGDPVVIPDFAETKAFVGEVAAGSNFPNNWPELKGTDANEAVMCSTRLTALARKGYKLAMLWPSRASNDDNILKFSDDKLEDVKKLVWGRYKDGVP